MIICLIESKFSRQPGHGFTQVYPPTDDSWIDKDTADKLRRESMVVYGGITSIDRYEEYFVDLPNSRVTLNTVIGNDKKYEKIYKKLEKRNLPENTLLLIS